MIPLLFAICVFCLIYELWSLRQRVRFIEDCFCQSLLARELATVLEKNRDPKEGDSAEEETGESGDEKREDATDTDKEDDGEENEPEKKDDEKKDDCEECEEKTDRENTLSFDPSIVCTTQTTIAQEFEVHDQEDSTREGSETLDLSKGGDTDTDFVACRIVSGMKR